MTLNGVMAVTVRYFTEFGKPALPNTICGGIHARVYCILVCVQCRRKESSRSLSHLLMSFLYLMVPESYTEFGEITQNKGHYAVQGHSRSPILVPIENQYTTFH